MRRAYKPGEFDALFPGETYTQRLASRGGLSLSKRRHRALVMAEAEDAAAMAREYGMKTAGVRRTQKASSGVECKSRS